MTAVPLDQVASVQVVGASDSRPCMKAIAKLLGLDEEATEEQVVEALEARPDLSTVLEPLELDLKDDASEEDIVEAVKAKLEEKGEEDKDLSLEDRAKKEGKIVLSEETVRVLTEKAERGDKAADELHQAKFDDAFEKALTDPKGARVDAKDETREKYQKLYDKAPEETIEILDGLPRLVNGEGKGKTGQPDELPEGADPKRHDLHKRVKARVKDEGEDYPTALEAVLADEGSTD